MFSQACVKNSVHSGVCISACTGADTPPCQVHAGIPHWADTPLGRHKPPRQTPPGQRHPQADTPRQTPFPGRHPPWANPPAQHMLGYTPPRQSLQWKVRILLECILVQSNFGNTYIYVSNWGS